MCGYWGVQDCELCPAQTFISGYRQVALAPGKHRGCFLQVLGEPGDILSGGLVVNQMGG